MSTTTSFDDKSQLYIACFAFMQAESCITEKKERVQKLTAELDEATQDLQKSLQQLEGVKRKVGELSTSRDKPTEPPMKKAVVCPSHDETDNLFFYEDDSDSESNKPWYMSNDAPITAHIYCCDICLACFLEEQKVEPLSNPLSTFHAYLKTSKARLNHITNFLFTDPDDLRSHAIEHTANGKETQLVEVGFVKGIGKGYDKMTLDSLVKDHPSESFSWFEGDSQKEYRMIYNSLLKAVRDRIIQLPPHEFNHKI